MSNNFTVIPLFRTASISLLKISHLFISLLLMIRIPEHRPILKNLFRIQIRILYTECCRILFIESDSFFWWETETTRCGPLRTVQIADPEGFGYFRSGFWWIRIFPIQISYESNDSEFLKIWILVNSMFWMTIASFTDHAYAKNPLCSVYV